MKRFGLKPAAIIISFTLLSFISIAQSSLNTGFPFITNFDIKKYAPFPQSWSIMQDNDGVMYFAITGLLRYDGVNWENIEVGINGQVVRCMSKDKAGRIYVGSSGELGYLAKDNRGKTKFRSLLSFIPQESRDFNDVWSVEATDHGIYFQSREKIFRFTPNDTAGKEGWNVKVWNPATQFLYSFYRDGVYYIHQQDMGLARLINDSITTIKGSGFLGSQRVQVMLPYSSSSGEKKYLVGAFISGLYLFDGKSFQPFVCEADSVVKNNRVYKGLVLRNGYYALATTGKGLLIIDKSGKIVNTINNEVGLQNDLVRDIYEDQAGSIWLALDKGVSRLETSSPLTQFTDKSGLIDNLNSVQIAGKDIFIGASTGLFKINLSTRLFERVPGISPGQVFDLLVDNNRLLLATAGIYCVENNKAFLIESPAGPLSAARTLLISKQHPDIMFAGLEKNVILFTRIKEKPYWKYAGTIKEVNDGGTQMIETRDGRIWIGTLKRGAFCISDYADKNGQLSLETIKIEHFIINEKGLSGVTEGIVPYLLKGGVILNVDSFMYRYNSAKNYFYEDTVLTRIVNSQGTSVATIIDNKDRIWVSGKNGTAVFSSGADGIYNENKSSFALIDGTISTVLLKEGNIAWLGGPQGLIRYDENQAVDYNKSFKTLEQQVIAGKDTLDIIDGNKPTLGYSNNSLRFDYAAPFFILEKQTQYQTWLEGFEQKWSDWGNNTYKEYTNLPEGDYTFHIKAKNVYGKTSEAKPYLFSVLPPWYRAWWAYILWALTGFAAIGGFIYYRSQKLLRENRMLEGKVALRTSQLNKSIEDLKSTQAQLVQSEKMASLGELTAGIAHEIQNPLNFINNFAEVNNELIIEMEEEISKGKIDEVKIIAEDIRGNNAKITHHGNRADGIVKSMLQHSRSSNGKRELTDINTLTDEYLRLSYQGMRAKDPRDSANKSFNATIKTDFDESIGKINIIPQDVGRVLLNLYNNAFYAVNEKKPLSPKGEYEPTVWVSTKKLGDKITISVKDNGSGIPQNIIDKIFQPFFTTKPTGQGTGLGLSLSYDIIKAHGGEISARSGRKINSEENEGTEFIISLPIA